MKYSAALLSFLAMAGLSIYSLGPKDVAIAHSPGQNSAASSLAKNVLSKTQVPLYEGLSAYNYPVSTKNAQAKRYFNQGLLLSYGFNHAEAARSFQEAARLDPNCAMCYWGMALVRGPHVNAGMDKDAVSPAWTALQKATQLSKTATPREQALIRALAKRYTPQAVEDRKPLDLAYANAMRQVAQRFPKDLDAATLFAEALMDTTPWDYWQDNGQPKPEAVEVFKVLEGVLAKNSNHPGANHLYIHAVEKERPELGLPSADRLMKLFPNAGHLVHMPSHIYIRTGRYYDAVLSNQLGVKADDAFLAQTQAQGIYPLAYRPHNHHFLWFAAMMTGQSKIAQQAAEQTAKVDPKLMGEGDLAGALQHYSITPLFTQIRFGQWDQILATPAPTFQYPKGIWHYARGMAFLGKGQSAQAAEELKQLQAIAVDPTQKEFKIWTFNAPASVLEIATEVLSGELAIKQGEKDKAIAHLQKAIKLEDALVYTEPPDWYQPTRQALGGILLKAGRLMEAEQAYREDLKIYPENGWSLNGLAQSLQAQGKTKKAQAILNRFQTAWKHADISLTALRLE
jgi:tetratricopeptide (TPR) repeat protein